MPEFWEENFKEKKEMWGSQPAHAAVYACKLFVENNIDNILIPGIGYGRNAKVFLDKNIQVSGIEISATAIEIATKYFEKTPNIYHGSVTDMPFDNLKYNGIFCHGLIHLLDEESRTKLISDCYRQLEVEGLMIFTCITKAASNYKQGVEISKDRFEMYGGVQMYFYDSDTIQTAFQNVGLLELIEIEENLPFYLIICKKKA